MDKSSKVSQGKGQIWTGTNRVLVDLARKWVLDKGVINPILCCDEAKLSNQKNKIGF